MNMVKESSVSRRNSNIELLRVIAMFLVLVVHADFFSLGAPNAEDLNSNAADSVLRVFFEALSIACVDIFIAISGYFGIHAKFKGLTKFLFQCAFFLIGIYAVTLLLGVSTVSFAGFRGCILATKLNWFVKAYLLLYILSPVLNAFVERADRKLFRNVLIGFYSFQFLYGWIFSSAVTYINGGYSIISFIGLYLLMRYVAVYRPKVFRMSAKKDFVLIACSVIFITLVYITPPVCFKSDSLVLGNMLINYISPVTIAIAVFSVVAFSKLNISSRFINWCAAGSFAVFLLHTNPNTVEYYRMMFRILHGHVQGFLFWGYTLIILVVIFFVALLLDQIRNLAWNKSYPLIENICIKLKSVI